MARESTTPDRPDERPSGIPGLVATVKARVARVRAEHSSVDVAATSWTRLNDTNGEWEEHMLPGQGIVDFRHVFRRLSQAGYTGPFTLDFGSPEERTTWRDTLATWLAGRDPLYRQDLTDGDGVLRRYAIYELSDDRLASGPAGGPPR